MRVVIRGAAENNLQDLDVEFEDGLTVVTGVSGSGKTSLVFDTLYHEARRRFLESFATGSSAYSLSPAVVRSVTGLGPAVAIGQNVLNRNPASTLATASGLHPFFRLLFARFGQRACPSCAAQLSILSEDEIVERIVEISQSNAASLLAPLVRASFGSHRTLLSLLETQFPKSALVVDGTPWNGSPLEPLQPHDILVSLNSKSKDYSVQQARALIHEAAALGVHAVVLRSEEDETTLSRAPVCARCGRWFGDLEPFHFLSTCPDCQGQGCKSCDYTGLPVEAASVRWRGLRLPDLLTHSVSQARELFRQSGLPSTAARLIFEVNRRLEALETVGLGYVHLNRRSPSLSRGESQRVRLAVALTSRLDDMLHVLDEPTVGQHPYDVMRLLPAFRKLPGPVIFVEHDRIAAAFADRAIDLGPGAGSRGGRLLYAGNPAGLWKSSTPTGRWFSMQDHVPHFPSRSLSSERLVVRGAARHNLRRIDISFPLGCLVVVTGVSGSGKSTLVEDVLVASLKGGGPIGCDAIEGPHLRPTMVDQSPIGINPRSNAATYTGLADVIRDLFASQTGLSASHFSFNRPEGACPACEGMGAIEVHMRYLPSSWISCSDCAGQRFSDYVLEKQVRFTGISGVPHFLSIADFYKLSVDEALPLLLGNPALPHAKRHIAEHVLRALVDVGLGYLPLGQPSPTLSGGEAQRVKLTKYLGRRSLAGELLILDEPSTGLHPQDVSGLLVVLDRLVRGGATVIVVEHNLDIIRAADWIIDLGPGAGPDGGRLLYSGPISGLSRAVKSSTARALSEEESIHPNALSASRDSIDDRSIRIRGACANNLKSVNVDIPKGALTVVTGVSGSGKSSLVSDVLEAEARRRFLESLSMYERQGIREGPEAEVESVSGLGVTASLVTDRRIYDRRATVGTITEIRQKLAVLFALAGQRDCPSCSSVMLRDGSGDLELVCPNCGRRESAAQPRHFMPSNYSSACLKCHGVGTLQFPKPEKLIIQPEKPLLDGAMYSPGFFPKGYLGKPYNGGYDMVQALAAKYGFDPFKTPWEQMSPQAQHAFLFGDPQPMTVVYVNRKGHSYNREQSFPGFYGWIRDWDTGGTYTETRPCPECNGSRLRPQYATVRLSGHTIHHLSTISLFELSGILQSLPSIEEVLSGLNNNHKDNFHLFGPSLEVARRRLHFLLRVGLGYLHLDRLASSLSAGEAQRIRLAGLLGSDLSSLTVLLDEPTRGLHPSEVEALLGVLKELRAGDNTVIVVEHEPLFIASADHIIDLGPGAGALGGNVVAQGPPEAVLQSDTLTAKSMRAPFSIDHYTGSKDRFGVLTLKGARANNLKGQEVQFPLGNLIGVCGVSGSGKSTLVIDTLGRILVPKKYTTSVAQEPIDPGEYDSITGAPPRAVLIDQARAGVTSPAEYLGLKNILVGIFAETEEASSLNLSTDQLSRRCTACGGKGVIHTDMGFLPSIYVDCETCQATGFLPEAWQVHYGGISLPDVFGLTVDEVLERFSEFSSLTRLLSAAIDVGLGYLVLRQPVYSLSGGEAQRLKIAGELCRRPSAHTLYILDEPTVGQHLADVSRLVGVLRSLVEAGNTVIVVEHHPHLLASCDWLIELGPGGGPQGGNIIFTGPPSQLTLEDTPTAPYIKSLLETRP